LKNLNVHCHFKVNISNDKAELYENIVSDKLLAIVIIVFQEQVSKYILFNAR